VDARRTVDARNIVSRLGSIFTGNVGVPQLVVGIYTAKSKESQMANKTERKILESTFFQFILMPGY
jgi:hypothetical protein